jgi:hypothetical protein
LHAVDVKTTGKNKPARIRVLLLNEVLLVMLLKPNDIVQ